MSRLFSRLPIPIASTAGQPSCRRRHIRWCSFIARLPATRVSRMRVFNFRAGCRGARLPHITAFSIEHEFLSCRAAPGRLHGAAHRRHGVIFWDGPRNYSHHGRTSHAISIQTTIMMPSSNPFLLTQSCWVVHWAETVPMICPAMFSVRTGRK